MQIFKKKKMILLFFLIFGFKFSFSDVVTIGPENYLQINGKPFFIIGSTPGPGTNSLEILRCNKECGFNTVITWNINCSLKEFMDEASRLGLKVILYKYGCKEKEIKEKSWDEIVKQYKDHPALLAYFIADEPDIGYSRYKFGVGIGDPGRDEKKAEEIITDLLKTYQNIKNIDSAHPVFLNLCWYGNIKYFKGTADIYGWDRYPFPEITAGYGPITEYVACIRYIQKEMENKVPILIFTQSFNWIGQRLPTPKEVRCSWYLCIVAGANGILDFGGSYPNTGIDSLYLSSAFYKSLTSEIHWLSPILLNGKKIEGIKVNSPLIYTLMKEYENKRYLIVVNAKNSPIEAEIEIPFRVKRIKRFFEDGGRIKTDKNFIIDKLEGYGVNAYEIE